MTGSDQDDDGKGFLARWSQRKQEAKQPEPKPDVPVVAADVPPTGDVQTDAAQEFDLSSLPKLDELTGSTDITAFLRKGVPEQLRNEALRKSWVLDPAIRNYVNPALEYAYDWNTPGGVPGSSELGASLDVARLVSQIMGGESGEAAMTTVDTRDAAAGAPEPSSYNDTAQNAERELPTQALRLGNEALSDTPDGCTVAEQAPKSGTSESAAPQQPVRRHGSAKPIA